MPVNRWLGDAQAVARVETYPVASPSTGETFGVEMNDKTVSVAAGVGDTAAVVAAALQVALAASTLAEFRRVTWSVESAVVSGTATNPGEHFVGAATGTGSLTRAVATAGTGPNHVSNVANWSLGAMPTLGDDTVIDGGSDLLYDLGLFNATGVLGSFTVRNSFTGTIGLPEWNPNGYREYLPRYLKFTDGVTAVALGSGDGAGSARVFLDFDGDDPAVSVVGTGPRPSDGLPPLRLTGLASGSTVSAAGGELGIAVETGQTATVTTLRATGRDTRVTLGEGTTVTTIDQDNGEVESYGTDTTLGITGGQYTKHAGTLTTVTADGGTVILRQGGTVATATFRGRSSTDPPTCDLSYDPRPLTFTDHSFTGGAVLRDPNKNLTLTNFGTWDSASIQASAFPARVSLKWT